MLKNVDGGFKPFLVLSDDSFMAFANKFAEDNIRDCFNAIGIEPPELPLEKVLSTNSLTFGLMMLCGLCLIIGDII